MLLYSLAFFSKIDCNLCVFYNLVVFIFYMFIRNLTSGCDDYADKISTYLHLSSG